LLVVAAGREGVRERSVGASSSWKAFSTLRRQKKVVIVLKGVTRRAWTFCNSAEEVIAGGSERVSGRESGGCGG
jgi:hypothetical protein